MRVHGTFYNTSKVAYMIKIRVPKESLLSQLFLTVVALKLP